MSVLVRGRYAVLARRAFLRRGAAGVAALLGLSGDGRAAPLPGRVKSGGVLVLDDCDPDYRGKAVYADNLSFYDAAGKLRARVSGLNNCEEIGSPHKIAVDGKRGCVWVVENVGHRLLKFDRKGKQLLAVKDVQSSALAVDPASGNVWLLHSEGRIGGGSTQVRDPKGRLLATHAFHGWDIAYDARGNCFWLAEEDLVKVSLAGKVLLRKCVAGWCSSSLAVNQKTGAVWVATREYSAGRGVDALLGLDNAGKLLHDIRLKAGTPFRVAVDSTTGKVWVTLFGGPVLGYTAGGKPEGELKVKAITADVEVGTGNVWVVTQTEVLKLDRKGGVLARARHAGKTTQAWVLSY
jgi:DNA-binding beta-propeller fold protein YncE